MVLNYFDAQIIPHLASGILGKLIGDLPPSFFLSTAAVHCHVSESFYANPAPALELAFL